MIHSSDEEPTKKILKLNKGKKRNIVRKSRKAKMASKKQSKIEKPKIVDDDSEPVIVESQHRTYDTQREQEESSSNGPENLQMVSKSKQVVFNEPTQECKDETANVENDRSDWNLHNKRYWASIKDSIVMQQHKNERTKNYSQSLNNGNDKSQKGKKKRKSSNVSENQHFEKLKEAGKDGKEKPKKGEKKSKTFTYDNTSEIKTEYDSMTVRNEEDNEIEEMTEIENQKLNTTDESEDKQCIKDKATNSKALNSLEIDLITGKTIHSNKSNEHTSKRSLYMNINEESLISNTNDEINSEPKNTSSNQKNVTNDEIQESEISVESETDENLQTTNTSSDSQGSTDNNEEETNNTTHENSKEQEPIQVHYKQKPSESDIPEETEFTYEELPDPPPPPPPSAARMRGNISTIMKTSSNQSIKMVRIELPEAEVQPPSGSTSSESLSSLDEVRQSQEKFRESGGFIVENYQVSTETLKPKETSKRRRTSKEPGGKKNSQTKPRHLPKSKSVSSSEATSKHPNEIRRKSRSRSKKRSETTLGLAEISENIPLSHSEIHEEKSTPTSATSSASESIVREIIENVLKLRSLSRSTLNALSHSSKDIRSQTQPEELQTNISSRQDIQVQVNPSSLMGSPTDSLSSSGSDSPLFSNFRRGILKAPSKHLATAETQTNSLSQNTLIEIEASNTEQSRPDSEIHYSDTCPTNCKSHSHSSNQCNQASLSEPSTPPSSPSEYITYLRSCPALKEIGYLEYSRPTSTTLQSSDVSLTTPPRTPQIELTTSVSSSSGGIPCSSSRDISHSRYRKWSKPQIGTSELSISVSDVPCLLQEKSGETLISQSKIKFVSEVHSTSSTTHPTQKGLSSRTPPCIRTQNRSKNTQVPSENNESQDSTEQSASLPWRERTVTAREKRRGTYFTLLPFAPGGRLAKTAGVAGRGRATLPPQPPQPPGPLASCCGRGPCSLAPLRRRRWAHGNAANSAVTFVGGIASVVNSGAAGAASEKYAENANAASGGAYGPFQEPWTWFVTADPPTTLWNAEQIPGSEGVSKEAVGTFVRSTCCCAGIEEKPEKPGLEVIMSGHALTSTTPEVLQETRIGEIEPEATEQPSEGTTVETRRRRQRAQWLWRTLQTLDSWISLRPRVPRAQDTRRMRSAPTSHSPASTILQAERPYSVMSPGLCRMPSPSLDSSGTAANVGTPPSVRGSISWRRRLRNAFRRSRNKAKGNW